MAENRNRLILGIDLGGTKVLTAVVNDKGEILADDYYIMRRDKSRDAVVKSILESSSRSLDLAHTTIGDISAIGLAAAGLSNPETGVLFSSPNLPELKDVPLSDIIEEALGRQTFIINDANAAALGELHSGAARGVRDFIYVTVSSGIGGGIVINGRIYTGFTGTAGEIGHMVIDDKGPWCSCGNRGCWETLASGNAMAKEAGKRIEDGAATSILDYADGYVEEINAEAIHRAARAGDTLAVELIARAAYYLGFGLANLINIFNPELIVIGGGLSNIGDMILNPAFEEAGHRAFKQPYQAVRFAVAELGRNSGVVGAAVYALGKIDEKDRNV